VIQEGLLEHRCKGGIWLASPLPALHEPQLLARFHGWVWTPAAREQRPPELPASSPPAQAPSPRLWQLPLQANDGTDPLLVLVSGPLQVALALHGEKQQRQLLVRFEPELLAQLLQHLGERLQQQNAAAARDLQHQLQQIGHLHSYANAAERFWPRLAERLAAATPSLTLLSAPQSASQSDPDQLGLLEAIAHEVRTPLATIRTLIRSLRRRQDLPSLVQHRLEQIDVECSEQIDRFGLIFQAAELQRTPSGDRVLARTELGSLLVQLGEGWQRQLQRRQLQLELCVEEGLPAVLSDPALLEKMLAGLMDRFSRGLRQGERVKVDLQAAGDRLKLRFSASGSSRGDNDGPGTGSAGPGAASVGPVLTWDPATGSLQLSPQATQRLFASLGGRFTERTGRNLTLYLPVAGNVEGCEESGSGPVQASNEC
jgi:signal transduction histidine kinase